MLVVGTAVATAAGPRQMSRVVLHVDMAGCETRTDAQYREAALMMTALRIRTVPALKPQINLGRVPVPGGGYIWTKHPSAIPSPAFGGLGGRCVAQCLRQHALSTPKVTAPNRLLRPRVYATLHRHAMLVCWRCRARRQRRAEESCCTIGIVADFTKLYRLSGPSQ